MISVYEAKPHSPDRRPQLQKNNIFFLRHLAKKKCENGPGHYYGWDSVSVEDLGGALFNMHGAIEDLRKFW